MKFTERRRSPRVQEHHLTAYTLYHGEEIEDQHLARTLDLGPGGVLLETIAPMEPGDHVTLNMQIGETIFSLGGTVLHVGTLPGGHFRVGIAFQDVPEGMLAHLAREIALSSTSADERIS